MEVGKRWMPHGCVQAVVRTDAGSEWTRAGVFQRLWAQGLLDYDELKGIEWEWQAMDGAMSDPPHWAAI
jgi:hypothetical protein